MGGNVGVLVCRKIEGGLDTDVRYDAVFILEGLMDEFSLGRQSSPYLSMMNTN